VCNTRPDYACILSKLIESLLLACHSSCFFGVVMLAAYTNDATFACQLRRTGLHPCGIRSLLRWT
jgi:hypothetical protein